MDQITITKDQFKEAVTKEIARLLHAAEGSNSSPVVASMTVMLVTTFAAALTGRLFNDKEEEKEDGADS